MAKNKKSSAYEELKKLMGTIDGYNQDLETLKANMSSVDSAASIAKEGGAPEAAQALQQQANYRDRANFIVAGLEDKTKELNSNFVKNRANLEAILGDKTVKPLLDSLVFMYEPKPDKKAGKAYADAAKLHKEVGPMHAVISQFKSGQLSKNSETQLFGMMSTKVISDYAKKYAKKPLFLRALVALAGGAVEENNGKFSIMKDDDGNPAIVSDREGNKQFAYLRYNTMYQEKKKEFYSKVGKDLPGYIAATLPEKQIEGFYRKIIQIEEQSKRE